MPTYEYVCKSCGEHLEVVQSFKDDPLTTCPACEGVLRKVFAPIGIVFKGSGFYKTDSRDSKRAKTDRPSAPSQAGGAAADTSSASSSSGDSSSGSGAGSTSGAATGSTPATSSSSTTAKAAAAS